jgi:DNA-directed RNA polymerase specialized sigma24 family protein
LLEDFADKEPMYFPTTQWSLLAQASASGQTAARQALEELCARYWSPLNRFIRARGYASAEAEDLTQEFLLHVLEHSMLQRVDPLRGKFRSFLLGALVRFLADEYDRRRAQKRGGGAVPVSLDEPGPKNLATVEPGALLFDREWAMALLEHALMALEQEFSAAAKRQPFEVLRRFLPGSLETPSYETAAQQLGLSLPALKSEVHRLRARFNLLVRQEVGATVSAPHDIDEEMEYLHQVLMDRGSELPAGKWSQPLT